MLKKKLGTEAIKKDWNSRNNLKSHFKIPSTLIIPKDCEKIGQYAFAYCMNLKKVVIPKSVEYIGYCAFESCYNATIILKKHKKDFRYIGPSAFSGVKDVKKEIRN